MRSTSGSNDPKATSRTTRETLGLFRRRIRQYTLNGTFTEACALVIGLDAGARVPFLQGFDAWLKRRTNQDKSLAFMEVVLREAGIRDKVARSDLTSAENENAVGTLFDLLDSYLAEDDSAN